MAVKIELGVQQLQKRLLEIPQKLAQKTVRAGVASVGRRLRDEARKRVPVLAKPHPYRKAGVLRKAVRAGSPRIDRKYAFVHARVYVQQLKKSVISTFKTKTGKNSRSNPLDPFYAIFVIRGRKRSTKKGAIQPKPFLDIAAESNPGQYRKIFLDEVSKRI